MPLLGAPLQRGFAGGCRILERMHPYGIAILTYTCTGGVPSLGIYLTYWILTKTAAMSTALFRFLAKSLTVVVPFLAY